MKKDDCPNEERAKLCSREKKLSKKKVISRKFDEKSYNLSQKSKEKMSKERKLPKKRIIGEFKENSF